MTSAKFRHVWTMRRLDIDGTAQTITFEIDVCRRCIRTYDKREHLPLAEQRNSARCRNCHFNSGRSPGRHLHRRHLASKLGRSPGRHLHRRHLASKLNMTAFQT